MINCGELFNQRNNDLQVKFNMKRRPAFKAGAELSTKVNLVAIDVNEDSSEVAEEFEMNIKIERSKNCESEAISLESIQRKRAELEQQLKCLQKLEIEQTHESKSETQA